MKDSSLTTAIVILVFWCAMLILGCDNPNPLQPTQPQQVEDNTPAILPITGSWPVEGTDGFGSEDPNYPPTGTQCPVDYFPRFNGHNWVCKSYVGPCVVFPKVEGYGLYSPFEECKSW